jgi:hypothetical protein
MMEAQHFNLSWVEFESTASNTFKDLFADNTFVDVTLACEDGHQINAHKVILSACSPFFQNILLKNPHQHPLLYLKGSKLKTLRSILNFIYRGEAEIAQEDLERFISTARDLQIKGLCDNYEIKKHESDRNKIEETEIKHFPTFENTDRNWSEKGFESDIVDLDVAEDFGQDTINPAIFSPEILSIYETFDGMQDEDGKHYCKHCDFNTTHKLNLKRHNLNIHYGVKFNCHQCDKIFSLKDSLIRHIKSIHNGVRYPCDLCNYKATQPFDLVAHRKKAHI